jgi:hypothetical protein
METTEREQFMKIIQMLAGTYRVEATDFMLLGYWEVLQDVPLLQVQVAARRAMTESDFMPSPKKLRELAGVLNASGRAAKAFEAVADARIVRGPYASVNFSDPLVNATIRNLGGWVRCCDLADEEFEKWYRKDFEKIYTSFCRTGISEEAGRGLLGIHARNNSDPALLQTIKDRGLDPKLCGVVAYDIDVGLPAHAPGIVGPAKPKAHSLPAPDLAALTQDIGRMK